MSEVLIFLIGGCCAAVVRGLYDLWGCSRAPRCEIARKRLPEVVEVATRSPTSEELLDQEERILKHLVVLQHANPGAPLDGLTTAARNAVAVELALEDHNRRAAVFQAETASGDR